MTCTLEVLTNRFVCPLVAVLYLSVPVLGTPLLSCLTCLSCIVLAVQTSRWPLLTCDQVQQVVALASELPPDG